jgi:secreted PhoX family phosphatase
VPDRSVGGTDDAGSRLGRRKFLGSGLALAGAAAAGSTAVSAAATQQPNLRQARATADQQAQADYCIVGAGYAGLTAAATPGFRPLPGGFH